MKSECLYTVPMNFKFSLILLLAIFLHENSSAQKEANIWYFGNYAGLDFNSGAPAVLTNSGMSAFEGCASIADTSGNILFYTDGMSVWNKNGNIMDNGTGLDGNSSSTQSGVIVPQPNNENIYYIFTVDAQAGAFGFRYSIVDISLQGGLGSVTQKNIPILNPSTEKITAVEKSPGEIWVVTHEWNSDNFDAYLLDANGLNATPVISSVGTVQDGGNDNCIGQMKISPDGNRLALAVDWGLQIVEVYDFDKNTGTVSNPLTLQQGFPGAGPYGVEFSPSSSILYAANESAGATSHVYQWNLLAGTPTDIINSVVELGNLSNAGSLQLAPDGKIYLSHAITQYLSVINYPDVIGSNCDFEPDVIDLTPGSANYGLPNFIQSYFSQLFISTSDVCFDDSTHFSFNNAGAVDSLNWNFDDPPSGANNFSSFADAYHIFTDTGVYDVQFISFSGGISDTVNFSVEIFAPTSVDLGNDTSTCDGQTFLLNASAANASYLWQDGSTDSTLLVSFPGTYFVQVTSQTGCSASDTIHITYYPLPDFTIGPDIQPCAGDFLILDASYPGATYLWQDGSSGNTYTVDTDGTYWVKVTDANGCSTTDSIHVNYVPLPPVPSITQSGTLLLASAAYSYQWQLNGVDIPGATGQFYVANISGLYTVIITDENGCSSSASIDVITGISTPGNEISCSVYPNPNQGTFNISIDLPENPGILTFQISNALGQMVYEERISDGSSIIQKEIQLKNLSSGIYFLGCASKNFQFVRKLSIIRN